MASSGLKGLQCLIISLGCWCHLDIDNWQQCYSHRRLAGSRHLESNPISRPFRLAHIRVMNCLIQTKLNQDLVGQRTLLPISRLVCAFCFYLESLVHSICDHELTLGLRPAQFAPCTLLLVSALQLSNDPRTSVRPFTYVCCVLAIYPSDVRRCHNASYTQAYFYSSTTLGVAVCLHSPQTKVCLLCVGVVLGTTIGVAIYCISRFPFLPRITLGMSSVFTALRPGLSAVCWDFRFPQHDHQHCCPSSQPSDQSLSAAC